jgi:hypothetical protein
MTYCWSFDEVKFRTVFLSLVPMSAADERLSFLAGLVLRLVESFDLSLGFLSILLASLGLHHQTPRQ